MNTASTYEKQHQEILVPCAAELQNLLESYLAGMPRVDRISVRAKSPASFLKKAQKIEDGSVVYPDPLGQIQDQIGARVIVFFTSDVEPTSERIQKYLTYIEKTTKEPKTEAEFGYFGRHYILSLPPDCVPANKQIQQAPPVFELQIRTLFQHAWSEAQHDIGYKPVQPLNADQKRRFAFTAAQAWGADRIFEELFDEVGSLSSTPRADPPI